MNYKKVKEVPGKKIIPDRSLIYRNKGRAQNGNYVHKYKSTFFLFLNL